jgi:hypothetical protein
LVDIFDYARLPESFQVAIDEGGVVLNDKTESV